MEEQGELGMNTCTDTPGLELEFWSSLQAINLSDNNLIKNSGNAVNLMENLDEILRECDCEL